MNSTRFLKENALENLAVLLLLRLTGLQNLEDVINTPVFMDGVETYVREYARYPSGNTLSLLLRNMDYLVLRLTEDGKEIVEYWQKDATQLGGRIEMCESRRIVRCTDGTVPRDMLK